MKKNRWVIGFCLLLFCAKSYALEYPHSPANGIDCVSCHIAHGPLPSWENSSPVDLDDTGVNNLCRSCHNGVRATYELKTHSSLSTDDDYGDWTVECRECHGPHEQEQTNSYGTASRLFTGTIEAVAVNTAANTSTLTQTEEGWTENEWAGMMVNANLSQQ